MTGKIRTGETVRLIPVSKQAKDQFHQQCSLWVVNAVTESVLFDDRKGLWLGLAAKSGHEFGFRWVLLEGDDHFIVQRKS